MRTIVYVLNNIKASETTSNEFSVKQFRTLKVAIELVTAIGIIPALLPGVGFDMAKLCPRALQICEEEVTDLHVWFCI